MLSEGLKGKDETETIFLMLILTPQKSLEQECGTFAKASLSIAMASNSCIVPVWS